MFTVGLKSQQSRLDGWWPHLPDVTAVGGTWSVSQMATSFSDLGCTWGAKAKPPPFCPLPESRTRAPMVVPRCDHAATFKRPHSTISDSSNSSSGSQSPSALGPLSLQASASPALPSSASCPWPYDTRTCLEEEDELEQETGSQPSMRECA